MPTYEYECTNCRYRFEAFQNIKAEPLTVCPKCGQKLRRLIGSGAGIIFKGSGFYATDYRKKPANERPKEDKRGVCPKREEPCGGCPGNPKQ